MLGFGAWGLRSLGAATPDKRKRFVGGRELLLPFYYYGRRFAASPANAKYYATFCQPEHPT